MLLNGDKHLTFELHYEETDFLGFSTRSDTNQPVQSKKARALKFQIQGEE